MINWILQKNITNQTTLNRIKDVLIKDHVSFEEVDIIPFSKDFPAIKNTKKHPIVYGSTTMMVNALHHPMAKKGVFFDPEAFKMSNYVKKWGNHMLNADGQLITFKAVKNLKRDNQKYFIRPNSDEKEFGGKVLTGKELIEWFEKIENLDIQQLHPNTKIWLAPPKTILKEWRIFIVDQQIISISKYMEHDQANFDGEDVPDSLLQFVAERIAEYQAHSIFVMDVALTKDGYKIIECNCFNGTGFYDHDIEKVVKAVNNKIRLDQEKDFK